MSRLFSQHVVRRVQSLDGPWDFYFPERGTELSLAEIRHAEVSVIEVPGVWESLAERVRYRGQAIARREFEVELAGPARIVFKGVSHSAKVFVDGREVGAHHNAYTPFAVDLASVTQGTHELCVHISNEHGALSGLHIPNDYYNYGGISRPVELHGLQASMFIRRVEATPRFDPERQGWTLDCHIVLCNLADSMPVDVALAVAGSRETLSGVMVEHGETVLRLELRPGAVTPWTPRSPELYFLEATLASKGVVFDDWRDRVGFRTVRCEGEQLLLNDEPVFLLGLNRHEDHPRFGCALPVSAMREDLALVLDSGANAIRTSH
jgi:beta-glucuronidase